MGLVHLIRSAMCVDKIPDASDSPVPNTTPPSTEANPPTPSAAHQWKMHREMLGDIIRAEQERRVRWAALRQQELQWEREMMDELDEWIRQTFGNARLTE